MTYSAIGVSAFNLESLRVRLREGQLNAMRDLLPDKVIRQACTSAGYSYRERLLTPPVVVLHYLSAALWPEESFQAAAAIGGLDVSSGALSKARKRLPTAVIGEIEGYVARLAGYLSEPYAFHHGFRVVTVDGTCLSMDDAPALMKRFGIANTRHGRSNYPEARLVVASLAGTGTVVAHSLGSYRTSEQALAMELLSSLKKGDLLVADAHFAGSNLYYGYLKQGLEFVTPAHQRLKIHVIKRVLRYDDGSFVGEMTIWKSHRRKYPFLPEKMRLRFVPVRLRSRKGNAISYLVTSLLDAKLHPAETIRRLYAMRWPVEAVFLELKHPLSADVLRSKTVEGIYKEVAAKIAALNLVRCLMLQAAERHRCEPSRLSFAHSRRVAVAYSLKMSSAPICLLKDLFEQMLDQIAFVTNPSRPGRIEPRAVRREFKHFERLRIPRSQWRRRHGLSA